MGGVALVGLGPLSPTCSDTKNGYVSSMGAASGYRNPHPLKQPEIRYNTTNSSLGTPKIQSPLGTLDSHGFDYLKTPALLRRVIWFTQSFNEISFSGERLWKDSDNQKIASRGTVCFVFMNFHGGFLCCTCLIMYLHAYIYIYVYKSLVVFLLMMYVLVVVDWCVPKESRFQCFPIKQFAIFTYFCHIVLGFMEAPECFEMSPATKTNRSLWIPGINPTPPLPGHLDTTIFLFPFFFSFIS